MSFNDRRKGYLNILILDRTPPIVDSRSPLRLNGVCDRISVIGLNGRYFERHLYMNEVALHEKVQVVSS